MINGNSADIYEIGNALKSFKEKLPFKLEFIVTNDKIELQDVDALINELLKLKKQMNEEKRFMGDKH